LPDGWIQVKHLPLLQMVASRPDGEVLSGPALTALGPGDSGAVSALIDSTNPGPFGTRTLEMGRYIGVFEDGQLVAMAGERLRLANYVELSAICTHPRARGRGLAEHLVRCLMRDAFARGQTPFLHVLPENAAAISLYRKLGFAVRTEIQYLWRKPIRFERQPR
jgi:ribosomal protein S18 acetylase RimI-like enzyme